MSEPTAAWLEAARTLPPRLVLRIPGIGARMAVPPGHYYETVDSGSPHHARGIAAGAMPQVVHKLASIFAGRTITTLGKVALRHPVLDTAFTGYPGALRGKAAEAWVTFEGLDFATDALKYFDARITDAEADGSGKVGLSLEPRATALAAGAWIPEGATTATLAAIVQARLAEAGFVYPDDYDTAAWTAWAAAGSAGAYTVNTQWSEGTVFDVIDSLIDGTLTWYTFNRAGKFYIKQWEDLSETPEIDLDLTTTSRRGAGAKMRFHKPVARKVEVKYNAAANSIVRSVGASTTAEWLEGAIDDAPIDCGIVYLADATNLADKRLAVLSAEHTISSIVTDCRLLSVNLGAVVKADLAAWKLPSAGLYHQVIEINENMNDGTVRLGLWTAHAGAPTS